MAGLFDTLSLGSRSLQTYRKAIDTAGHNLANVNTPGYTRQRVVTEAVTTGSSSGAIGMGAEAARIVGLKNEFAQKQLQVESSVEGSLEVKEDSMRQALTALQETIDRNGDGGTSTNGISQKLSNFFTALQSLSTNPSSLPERTVVLQKAQELAAKFNQVDARLGALGSDLNSRITSDVGRANGLLKQIAEINKQIAGEEMGGTGASNDLRDTRQTKLEELAKVLKVDAFEQENGTLNVIVDGQSLVDGVNLSGTLEAFDPGDGNILVRVAGQAAPLNPGGGSLEGAMSVRDGQLADIRSDINNLASLLISEVNSIHTAGFGASGTTGALFFQGSDASDIGVNKQLSSNPALLQGSGSPSAAGDNSIIMGLVALAAKAHAGLDGQTFSGKQAQTVARLAQDVATARTDLEDQRAISSFVRGQRDSVSAVSLDEEMANLVMFQKAFQASAKLISMTDEMLQTLITM